MAAVTGIEGLRRTWADVGADGRECVCCPYCSRMYPLTDDRNRATRPPEECERCGSPMDVEMAREYAEEQARSEHVPALAALGKATRRAQEAALAEA